MTTLLTFPIKIDRDTAISCGDFADELAALYYPTHKTLYKKRILASKLAQHAVFEFLIEYGMTVSGPHFHLEQVIGSNWLPQLTVVAGEENITVHCKGIHPDHQVDMPLHWDLYKHFPNFSMHDYIALCDCRQFKGTYFIDICAVTSVNNLVNNPCHTLINHSDLMDWPHDACFDLIQFSPLAKS